MLHVVTTGAYYPPVVTTWKILTTGASQLTAGSLCSVEAWPERIQISSFVHHHISVEMVLSRLKAGGAGTTTKEKVTLQREGFKRPASQHSGWSQLCRRRTFKRLLKVESDLATVDCSQYYYMRQENGEAYSIFVSNLTRSPANCKYSLWWHRLLNLYSHVRQCAAAA